ncbi:MAG: hypothetical protein WC614_01540 [bacterium]
MTTFLEGIAGTLAGSLTISLVIHLLRESEQRKRYLLELLSEIRYNQLLIETATTTLKKQIPTGTTTTSLGYLLHNQAFQACQLTGYIFCLPQKDELMISYGIIYLAIKTTPQMISYNQLQILRDLLRKITPALEKTLNKSWWWQDKIQKSKKIFHNILGKLK